MKDKTHNVLKWDPGATGVKNTYCVLIYQIQVLELAESVPGNTLYTLTLEQIWNMQTKVITTSPIIVCFLLCFKFIYFIGVFIVHSDGICKCNFIYKFTMYIDYIFGGLNEKDPNRLICLNV